MRKKHINRLNTHRNVLRASLRTFFFVLVSWCQTADAQFLDTISDALHKRPGLTFNFDTRNTFIANRRAEIFGLKAGFKFGSKFRFGFGYNFLSSADYKYFESNIDTAPLVFPARLRIRYASVYTDYQFHKSKRWEFGCGLQAGVGTIFYGPDVLGRLHEKRGIFVYEPTINAEYQIFKWLGFGGKYGYRVVVGKRGYTAPIYSFGFSIYWMTIYRGTRDWIKKW